jgi:hypothetical protein
MSNSRANLQGLYLLVIYYLVTDIGCGCLEKKHRRDVGFVGFATEVQANEAMRCTASPV